MSIQQPIGCRISSCDCEKCHERDHASDTAFSEDQTQALFDFLKGDVPRCLTLDKSPRLDSDTAFSIIYYLQECAKLIPDSYELCPKCDCIYDVDGGSCGCGYDRDDYNEDDDGDD